MVIDPTSALGKVRLRIGDWSDLPILPDTVINATLADCNNNVPRASALCAQYILATLTAKTHKKLANIETWSSEQFENYVKFIKLTILNPHNMSIAPVPYVNVGEEHPLIAFTKSWNEEYAQSTIYTL